MKPLQRTTATQARILATAISLSSLAAVGCGGARGATPEMAVQDFADAIDAGRYRQAYDGLSESYRARVSFEEFRRYLEEHPEDARELSAAMSRRDGPADITASVEYADGQSLPLVQEDGQWRIAANPVNFYDQSTPRAAVRSFVRAMERRRYDIVLRFIPSADREGMTEERLRDAFEGDSRESIERMLASLRAELDNPIEEVGERATMAYGDGATVQFVREDGAWKIEDPD